jgi:hypothetical protein
MLEDKLTWNICRSSSATRLRRRIVAMVTAMVCGGSAGGEEAEPLGGAPWCSSMPYSMDTAPTSSVTWSVPTSCVGSSLLGRRRTLPLHLHKDQRALGYAELSTTPWRRATATHIFNLGSRWRWTVSSTPRPLYPRRMSPPPPRVLTE